MKDAKQILTEALSERKASNPRYSLRAFARDLGLSAPQLSNVMNGHRGLSPTMAEKVVIGLSLDDREKNWFKESLRAKFSPSKNQRKAANEKISELKAEGETYFLEIDLFKAVSNWYHFALIELIKISKNQKNQVTYFAQKLGLAENEIRMALGRLERLELIDKTSQGYQVNQESVIAEQAIPSEAVRNFHRQILEKSMQALTFQSPAERYGYSAIMPVKVKNVSQAKKLIQKFRTSFAKQISDHEAGEEVYGLSVQFFRLSQMI